MTGRGHRNCWPSSNKCCAALHPNNGLLSGVLSWRDSAYAWRFKGGSFIRRRVAVSVKTTINWEMHAGHQSFTWHVRSPKLKSPEYGAIHCPSNSNLLLSRPSQLLQLHPGHHRMVPTPRGQLARRGQANHSRNLAIHCRSATRHMAHTAESAPTAIFPRSVRGA
jgi:hypothetical protein